MKIKSVKFTNHYLFKDLVIDFVDDKGRVLDLVVLAGVNGTGKSTLFREIYDVFKKSVSADNTNSFVKYDKDNGTITADYLRQTDTVEVGIVITLSCTEHENLTFQDIGLNKRLSNSHPSNVWYLFQDEAAKHDALGILQQKIIFSPSELNSSFYDSKIDYYDYEYNFLNIVNKQMTDDVAVYYMTMLDRYVYSDPKITVETSLNKMADDINRLFTSLELTTKFIGRHGESRLPFFRNKAGHSFDINGLSSGEKQLFCRFMTYRMLEPNNSIMMIDEPENSLHPAWQQRIVNLFQNVGTNNQIFIATQSPNIIASVPKESLRFLELTDNESEPVCIAKWNKYDMNNGMPAERILKEIMGLSSTRNVKIAGDIEQMWDRVIHNDPEDEDLINALNDLSNVLGTTDEDIILLKAQLNLRRKGKKHVIYR